MQINAGIISVISVMMCFTINNTLPLHRNGVVSKESVFPNASKECDSPVRTRDSITKRSKKMTSNFENALKRIKISTQDFGKNIYNQVNSGLRSVAAVKSPVSDEDLRQYERLVIMKKYPFMDIKEYELFSPSKKSRNNAFAPEEANFGNSAGICELMDDVPNVEITNRGLSGFAIPAPTQLSKHLNLVEHFNLLTTNDKLGADLKLIQTQEHRALGSLKDEVLEYVEQKINRA